MTDQEMLGLLRADFRGVSEAVIDLGKEVAGLTVKVDTVCREVDNNRRDIRELQRDDITGQVDAAHQRALSASEKASARIPWMPMLRVVGPWLVALLIGVGVYLGSGGDTAAMANAIRAVNDTTLKLSRKIDRIEAEQEAADDIDVTDTDPLR